MRLTARAHMRGGLPWPAVVLLLLPGCMGASSSDAPLVVTPTLDARPTVTNIREGPGAIEGTVVDDELRPIRGAMVEIFRRLNDIFLQLQMTTSETGRFVAQGLAQGEYVVYVSGTGFYPDRPRLLLVEDGKTTQMRWTLEPLPHKVPFHATKTFRGSFLTYACLRLYGDNVSQVCSGPLSNRAWPASTYPVDEENQMPLETLVVELRWTTAAQAVCRPGFVSHVYSPEEPRPVGPQSRRPENPYHWDSLPNVGSPTRLLIPRTGDTPVAMHSLQRIQSNGGVNLTVHGDWRVEIEPHTGSLATQFTCAINQGIDAFVTFFHGTPARSTFTAIK